MSLLGNGSLLGQLLVLRGQLWCFSMSGIGANLRVTHAAADAASGWGAASLSQHGTRGKVEKP